MWLNEYNVNVNTYTTVANMYKEWWQEPNFLDKQEAFILCGKENRRFVHDPDYAQSTILSARLI